MWPSFEDSVRRQNRRAKNVEMCIEKGILTVVVYEPYLDEKKIGITSNTNGIKIEAGNYEKYIDIQPLAIIPEEMSFTYKDGILKIKATILGIGKSCNV